MTGWGWALVHVCCVRVHVYVHVCGRVMGRGCIVDVHVGGGNFTFKIRIKYFYFYFYFYFYYFIVCFVLFFIIIIYFYFPFYNILFGDVSAPHRPHLIRLSLSHPSLYLTTSLSPPPTPPPPSPSPTPISPNQSKMSLLLQSRRPLLQCLPRLLCRQSMSLSHRPIQDPAVPVPSDLPTSSSNVPPDFAFAFE